ncbi:MAG: TetR/AcrR family transcriptional regulator [Flavobacteriaceae bacterium]|nr:TetR/AcrR family transcriptional regulator [Flavobacteriaceae bacterium]
MFPALIFVHNIAVENLGAVKMKLTLEDTKHDPVREKILMATDALFMRLGVKSITMDDVCRELGISKKTLYQYFTDKADLVYQCMLWDFQKREVECTRLLQEHNAIDAILSIMEHSSRTLKRLNPVAVQDIRRFYPESWKIFENHKNKFVFQCVSSNFKKGIEDGLYRENMSVDILARIYVETIMLIMSDMVFPAHQFSFLEVYYAFMEYHLHGICTPKGLKYLEKKQKEINKK